MPAHVEGVFEIEHDGENIHLFVYQLAEETDEFTEEFALDVASVSFELRFYTSVWQPLHSHVIRICILVFRYHLWKLNQLEWFAKSCGALHVVLIG